MKFCLVLLAIVVLVAGKSTTQHEVKVTDKKFLQMQKFLLEIVYRMEDPLAFKEWIEVGKSFSFNKADYSNFDIYMQKFDEAYKYGALLPKGDFFGSFAMNHIKQAYGLFEMFYYAKNWELFQRNVAWARLHCNEGMFVYALTLSVIHRPDFQGLILPSIYEIFPNYFFNSKLIYAAGKFHYDNWRKNTMYETDYQDTNGNNNNTSNYTRSSLWKKWQWWKIFDVDKQWKTADPFLLRDIDQKYNRIASNLEIFEGIKMFSMPVDYTRDIKFFNKESALSYFTEDVGLNAYWYYLNMDYNYALEGQTFGLSKDRRGEYWLYKVRQILARYYLERLSHGYGEITEFSFLNNIEHGYHPQLVHCNGVGFSCRKNYYEIQNFGKFDYSYKVLDYFNRLDEIITKGVYVTYGGKSIDLRKPESIEYIGTIAQANMDIRDEFFFKYWAVFAHMFLADVDIHDLEIQPHIFLNYETMLRDPLFYMFYKKIASVYYQFFFYVKSYTHEELLFPGVSIKNVNVSELCTFFNVANFDVSNLLNEKMHFVDGQFIWNQTLLARQVRLNHKPFEFEFTIESDKPHKVVIRTFLAPKYDEFGRVISLAKNRENFYEIDSFIYKIISGANVFKRNSDDFLWTIKDSSFYTELYKYVMLAVGGQYEFPSDISQPHCGFPDRLILPRGWSKGMPMQMFFIVTPFIASYEPFSTYNRSNSCGIGSGVRHIDEKPFGYPFDREIEDYAFLVPNMYFEDVKIYHQDIFE